MNDKEKAINIGENNLDRCFGSKRDYGVTCALEMAQWKDEQYRHKLEMILNAPNEVIRIELLTKLIHNEL